MSTSRKVWSCPLCEWFGGVSMKRVMRHIGALHAHEAGFHICCGIAGCPRTYKNFASFQKHLYRIHRDVLEIDADDREIDAHDQETTIPVDATDDVDASESMEDHSSGTNVFNNSSNSFPLTLKQVGLFLLKAKEVYKVPESHLGSLLDDISVMIDLTVNYLEEKVEEQLKKISIGMNCDMKSVFQCPQLKSVFARLKTKSQLQNFVKDNLEVVVSHVHSYCKT